MRVSKPTSLLVLVLVCLVSGCVSEASTDLLELIDLLAGLH
jgi:hypothetical protein